MGFEILGDLAHGLDRLMEVAAIKLGEMPSRNANRIDHVLVAPGEHLEQDQILRLGNGTSRPNRRCLRARARASSSKGSEARMTSSSNWPFLNRSVPVARSFSRSSGATRKPAATAASISARAFSIPCSR